MREKKRIRDAVEILHRRYVGDDPKRLAAMERVRRQAEIARTVYQLRTEAGLTQAQLARLVGTTQSAISRLEDEEYEGHSVEMLRRIAAALRYRVTLTMETQGSDTEPARRLQVSLG